MESAAWVADEVGLLGEVMRPRGCNGNKEGQPALCLFLVLIYRI